MKVTFQNICIRLQGTNVMPIPPASPQVIVFNSYEETTTEEVFRSLNSPKEHLLGLVFYDEQNEILKEEIFLTADQMNDFINKYNNTPQSGAFSI